MRSPAEGKSPLEAFLKALSMYAMKIAGDASLITRALLYHEYSGPNISLDKSQQAMKLYRSGACMIIVS